MKNKILMLLLIATVCISMLALPSHAAGNAFRFAISDVPQTAESGDTLNLTLTLTEVQDKNGILSADFNLRYDSSVFEFVESKLTRQPSAAWFFTVADHPEEEYATFFLVDNMVSNPAKGGEIVISVTFKVKDDAPAAKAAVFGLTDINGSDSLANLIEGAVSSANITVNPAPPLAAPTVTAQTDSVNGGIFYTLTDPNDANSVEDYTVTLRRASDRVGLASVTSSSKTGFFAASADVAPAGETYIVSVVANAKSGGQSSEEVDSETVVMGDAVKSIAVSAQPKLYYTVGQTLDLSDLAVTVKYVSGKTETVSYADFAAHAVSVEPAQGTALDASRNGSSVKVTLGDSFAMTLPMTVTQTVCEHKNTHKTEVAPTCGADGSSTLLCDDCGAVLSVTALTDRPEHKFGEREKTYHDPETGNTVYTSVCSVCGETKQETVMESTDTQPGNTGEVDPPTTTTNAVTTAPAEQTTGGEEEKGGCASVVFNGIGSVALLLGTAVVALRRKENN